MAIELDDVAEQLTLNVHLRDDAHFNNFYVDATNAPALHYLQNFLNNTTENYAYVWGKPATGRSHLLQACCEQARSVNLQASYLPFNAMLAPEMLDCLEFSDLVCLDDINVVAGNSDWEEALFHFFNRIKETGKHLLISGICAPRELAIKLPDLKSRLTSGVIFQLHELSDSDKLAALRLHAQQRGLELPDEAAEFLLRRWSRDMPALLVALEKLDRASLAAQRKLTVPFIKQVLVL